MECEPLTEVSKQLAQPSPARVSPGGSAAGGEENEVLDWPEGAGPSWRPPSPVDDTLGDPVGADVTQYASAASGEGESPLPKRLRADSGSPGGPPTVEGSPAGPGKSPHADVAETSMEAIAEETDKPVAGPSASLQRGWSKETIEGFRRGTPKPPDDYAEFYDLDFDQRRLRILECRAAFKTETGLDPGDIKNSVSLRKFGFNWGKEMKLHLFDPFSEPEGNDDDDEPLSDSDDLGLDSDDSQIG